MSKLTNALFGWKHMGLGARDRRRATTPGETHRHTRTLDFLHTFGVTHDTAHTHHGTVCGWRPTNRASQDDTARRTTAASPSPLPPRVRASPPGRRTHPALYRWRWCFPPLMSAAARFSASASAFASSSCASASAAAAAAASAASTASLSATPSGSQAMSWWR